MTRSLHTGLLSPELETPIPISSRRPAAPAPLPDDNSRLVFLTEPDGVAVEQYKILRHRLASLHPRGGTLLITSPGPGEGKTLTAANLAWCLAGAGHRTCLVDLDLRAPGLSQTLDIPSAEFGVEDILSGKRPVSQVVRPPAEYPFAVIPVRRRRASPGTLLGSAGPMLTELRLAYEWVLLDLAPVIPMSDVGELLPQVDGALLVVRSGTTAKSLVTPALELLGPALWGVVLNDAPISGSAYYGHYGLRRD